MNEQDIYIYYYNKLKEKTFSLLLDLFSYWYNNLEKIYYLFNVIIFRMIPR